MVCCNEDYNALLTHAVLHPQAVSQEQLGSFPDLVVCDLHRSGGLGRREAWQNGRACLSGRETTYANTLAMVLIVLKTLNRAILLPTAIKDKTQDIAPIKLTAAVNKLSSIKTEGSPFLIVSEKERK